MAEGRGLTWSKTETLWSCCESCGSSRIATHEVTFHDSRETFLVCRDCADEAVDRGFGTAKRIAHLGIAQ